MLPHIISHLPIYIPFLLCHFPFPLFCHHSWTTERRDKSCKRRLPYVPLQISCLEVQNPAYQRKGVWVDEGKTHARESWPHPSINTLGKIFVQASLRLQGVASIKVRGLSSIHTEREQIWFAHLSLSEITSGRLRVEGCCLP